MTDEDNRELPDWMRRHLERYLETNGAEGHIWNGVPTLLLTTLGKRTGRARTLPLIYGKHGDAYVVVASKGGAPDHPSWYQNLAAHPEVDVQVGPERFRARARTAKGSERKELWALMTGIWPAYDEYQGKTSREIPVVVLERRGTR